MRKCVLAMGLLVSMLAGCSFIRSEASLSLVVENESAGSRTLYSEGVSGIDSYILRLCIDGVVKASTSSSSSSMNLVGIAPGTYVLSLEALNSEGIVVAHAEKTVVLSSGNNEETVVLMWSTLGRGSIHYVVDWPVEVPVHSVTVSYGPLGGVSARRPICT